MMEKRTCQPFFLLSTWEYLFNLQWNSILWLHQCSHKTDRIETGPEKMNREKIDFEKKLKKDLALIFLFCKRSQDIFLPSCSLFSIISLPCHSSISSPMNLWLSYKQSSYLCYNLARIQEKFLKSCHCCVVVVVLSRVVVVARKQKWSQNAWFARTKVPPSVVTRIFWLFIRSRCAQILETTQIFDSSPFHEKLDLERD